MLYLISQTKKLRKGQKHSDRNDYLTANGEKEKYKNQTKELRKHLSVGKLQRSHKGITAFYRMALIDLDLNYSKISRNF